MHASRKGHEMPAKLAVALLIPLARPALAAEPYPDRPITLTAPYAAGRTPAVPARPPAAELFQAKTGIKLVRVRCRGAGPAMNDLVAGHVQSGLPTLATASLVLDRVRALAIAGETRLATRTSIPTFRDGGIDLVVEHWWGMLAPAGLPPEIAARLTGDLKAILDSHELATRLAPLGVTASHASPAQFRALIESDTARWADTVKSIGISVP